MKTFLTVIIVLIIIGGGYWYYQNNFASTANENTNTNEAMMNDNMNDDVMHDNMNDSMMDSNDSNTNDDSMMEDDPSAKVFEIGGQNFSYDVQEIRVKKGDTVKINFTSINGFHDWVIDEFDARTKQVQTGGTTSVTFVADQVGTFEYYCSVGQHRANGMVGKLVVEE